jgi:alkaline phosphatase D
MTFAVDRRSIVQAGVFGISALGLRGCAAAMLAARGFTHDVASGEPSQNSALLWTRYVPTKGDTARLVWEVSPTADFTRIVSTGEAVSEGAHDHCVKAVAGGLEPGRWYHYRFRDRHGLASPVGRTRTLPDGPVDRFRLAFFSCSNLGFGWFNAYAHAAARRDLDLMVHVGDYLYEHRVGDYPGPGEGVRTAAVRPRGELIHLADYRLRYAAYRSDPDLQRLHRTFPMVAMWDDHESADDSWEGGAANHQPETEGPWSLRKAAAMRAYREWMPVGDEPWASYEIGDLATLFRPETRLIARSKQLDRGTALGGQSDIAAALAAFRDGPWQDPARTLMGIEQEGWLADGLRRSVARGARWQVLAQQVAMGVTALPQEAMDWIGPNASAETRAATAIDLAASKAGLPYYLDSWDGYPAARRRLVVAALGADANLVGRSGGSHNSGGVGLE